MRIDKLLLCIFLLCITYIFAVELYPIDVCNPYLLLVRLGAILLNVAYSLVAATIFYLIIVYRPAKRKWTKIAADIIFKTNVINNQINSLQFKVKVGEDYIFDINKIKIALNEYEVDKANSEEELYSGLSLLRSKLIPIINSLKAYNDLLDDDYLEKLSGIENYLQNGNAFQGTNRLNLSLSDEDMIFQGVFIANKQLKELKLEMERNNKKLLALHAQKFRKRNFPNES
jgi:hypothetical protein